MYPAWRTVAIGDHCCLGGWESVAVGFLADVTLDVGTVLVVPVPLALGVDPHTVLLVCDGIARGEVNDDRLRVSS